MTSPTPLSTIAPIFVSHSHLDNAACQALVAFLAGQFPGVDIFFDQSDLHGGDDWMQRIQREVIARPNFIVVLSRHSVVAEWVREETNLALSRAISDKAHRRVIPVIVDAGLQLAEIDQLAPLLTTRQLLDFANNPTGAQADLARVLRGEISGAAPRVDPNQLADLERARDLANQMHAEVTAQHWLNAVTLGRRAVKLPGNDRDPALWGDLAAAYYQADMLADAVQACAAGLNLNKYRADLWRLQAQALFAQSQTITGSDAKAQKQKTDLLDAASAAWEEAEIWTGVPKERLAILDEHCGMLIAARRWPAAAFLVRKARELVPNDAMWQQRQVSVQLGPIQDQYAAASARQDWAAALAACDAALQLAPNDAAWQQRHAQAQAQIAAARRAAEEAARQRQAQEQAARVRQEQEAEEKRLDALCPRRMRSDLKPPFLLREHPLVITPPTVEVPAGPFTMGSDKKRDPQAQSIEYQVRVDLPAYRIGVYPVTVAEYACALAVKAKDVTQPNNWASQQQHPDHPVVNISWLMANAYAAWLSQVTGEAWRLPTEAEWEKAARGTDGRIYPWGDQWDKTRANTGDGGPGGTTPVGQYMNKDASPYGCHDMAGNVWEWTSSLWNNGAPYDKNKSENDSDRSNYRVLRGGSWAVDPRFARAACRLRYGIGDWNTDSGFRLVLARVGAGSH